MDVISLNLYFSLSLGIVGGSMPVGDPNVFELEPDSGFVERMENHITT
jgi:hypothetical protein